MREVRGGRADSPLSLAVQPAGALSSTESKLRSSEEGSVTLTVLDSIVLHTLPSGPSYGVTGSLAERLAQVTPGGQEGIQVTQTSKVRGEVRILYTLQQQQQQQERTIHSYSMGHLKVPGYCIWTFASALLAGQKQKMSY